MPKASSVSHLVLIMARHKHKYLFSEHQSRMVKSLLIIYIVHLLLSQWKKSVMFYSNLFLFCLCSLLFSFFASFFFPCGVWPVHNWGGTKKEVETTMKNSLCGLFLVKSFHSSCSSETTHRPFKPVDFLSACSRPWFSSVWTSSSMAFATFHPSTTTPKLPGAT